MNAFQCLDPVPVHHYGDPFYVEVPSTEKWSNTNVLFQPTGFMEDEEIHLMFFYQIVTNTMGTGTIQFDGVAIDALLYKRVPNSGFYYYEQKIFNTTYSVTTTDPTTRFYVSISTLTRFSRKPDAIIKDPWPYIRIYFLNKTLGS